MPSKKTAENQKGRRVFLFKTVDLCLKRFFIGLIRIYQRDISPHKPRTCRFYPSCSTYALEALSRYGSLKGFALSLKRVLKCNPFHPGGFDPLE